MMDSLMNRKDLKPKKKGEAPGRRPFARTSASSRSSAPGPVKPPSKGAPHSPLSSKQSLTAFWDQGADVVDRQAAALKAHKMRTQKGKHVHKTLSAYKVKYTVMSKESKHFLELVVQRLMHCWRRKQALELLRCFNHWARHTLELDLQSAREIKSLRKEVKTTKERANVFATALLDGEDGEDFSLLTPEESERLLKQRWQSRLLKEQEQVRRRSCAGHE